MVRALYDEFVRIVEGCGPVTIIPQRTRIAFQVRMRFAALMPRRTSLKGHLVLAERQESPCFSKIETYSPRNHVHVFSLSAVEQMGDEFRRWVGEAYRVGRREHLGGEE